MGDQHEHVELILCAEPGGELGARCAEYWAAVSAAEASTTAQEYPPHVALTGIFRRRSADVPVVIAACAAAVDAAVPPGLDGSRWAGPVALEFQSNDDWIGLHVAADWMDAVVTTFVDDPSIQPCAGDDEPLRPKSWLHLSLSHGEQFEWAREEATVLAEPFHAVTAESEWTVSLWHRREAGWEPLAAIPVTCRA